ncbi:hypothetical protein C8Q75DRAFT_340155 [Abortiporus biennis]|nr:hypothetical protein C8Q75DRAFT_340155 [Abortiporus biennis]
MSFQHFRLNPVTSQPPPVEPVNSPGTSSLSQALGSSQPNSIIHAGFHLQPLQNGSKKGPYGSGDADDGYTLIFPSMEAFQQWRLKEEEEKMVEFVKGDTHGSKAVPPRFKDHTKLVCARHSRSGRKKYVKKYPDRVRKVPSRKLDGQGCPASISYKTYFDSDEVRACYISEHSHEIGLANLPFTKRGRRAQAEQSQSRPKTRMRKEDSEETAELPDSPPPTHQPIAGPSIVAAPPTVSPQMVTSAPSAPPESASAPVQRQTTFQESIQMLPPIPQPAPLPSQLELSQQRWDRMAVLFQSIREHARTFEYPAPSVTTLESVLIRLYLESPLGGMPVAPQPMPDMSMNGMSHMNGVGDGT